MGNLASSLTGNFVILTNKIKEIHKGNMPYWRDIWSNWRKILTCLQANEHFFQPCLSLSSQDFLFNNNVPYKVYPNPGKRKVTDDSVITIIPVVIMFTTYCLFSMFYQIK